MIFVPIGLLAAIASGIVWDAHRTADAVLEQGRIETDRLLAEYRARDTRRPPFGGEALEGEAWDLYRKVLPILGNLPPEDNEALPSLSGDADTVLDDQRQANIFARLEPQIELLRQALRRHTVNPRARFEEGAATLGALPLNECLNTSRLLHDQARHHVRLNHPEEAFHRMLLGLAFAQDVGRHSAIIGLLIRGVCEGIMMEGFHENLASHTATSVDWTGLASGLDALTAIRPNAGEAWDGEDLFLRHAILEQDLMGYLSQKESALGWRHLWSVKILRAQSMNRFPEYAKQGRESLLRQPWDRIKRWKQLKESWSRDSNPILAPMAGNFHALQKDIEGLLSRTLLRVAVGIAWYETEKGAWPATLQDLVPRYLAAVPPCPYTGTPLRYQDGRVWSVGADGVDNGGQPEPPNDDPEKAGADVVWVVARRK